MRSRALITIICTALAAVPAVGGVGPTLTETEKLEELVEGLSEATLESIDNDRDEHAVFLKYRGDYQQSIEFMNRVARIFELTYLGNDWSMMTLEPDGTLQLKRNFKGIHRPCGEVVMTCGDNCDILMFFPKACGNYVTE